MLSTAVFALAVFTFVRMHGGDRSADLGGLERLDANQQAECAAQWSDCRTSQCCQTGGQTCFEKNQYWAMCMDACYPGQSQPGDPDQETWTCKALGVRAKFEPGCAWAGDDC